MKIHSLSESMGIQLGCKGSKSKIVFSTSEPVWYCSIVGSHYFNVVNINWFNAIIGMGFMHKFGIMLDPKHDSILIGGTPAPTFSEGEERTELVRRHSLQCAQPVSHWHEEVGLSDISQVIVPLTHTMHTAFSKAQVSATESILNQTNNLLQGFSTEFFKWSGYLKVLATPTPSHPIMVHLWLLETICSFLPSGKWHDITNPSTTQLILVLAFEAGTYVFHL